MNEQALGERVARMETKLEFVQKEISELKKEMREEIESIKAGQKQIYEILTQAKGVRSFLRWTIWILPPVGTIVYWLNSNWHAIKAIFSKATG